MCILQIIFECFAQFFWFFILWTCSFYIFNFIENNFIMGSISWIFLNYHLSSRSDLYIVIRLSQTAILNFVLSNRVNLLWIFFHFGPVDQPYFIYLVQSVGLIMIFSLFLAQSVGHILFIFSSVNRTYCDFPLFSGSVARTHFISLVQSVGLILTLLSCRSDELWLILFGSSDLIFNQVFFD